MPKSKVTSLPFQPTSEAGKVSAQSLLFEHLVVRLRNHNRMVVHGNGNILAEQYPDSPLLD